MARSEIHSSWWRHAVIYQIYIRSFADGSGDGVGDIAGIRRRLPYLSKLGIDAIWITPWYPSPMVDGGYDVADYRDIDRQFGTLAEAEALIAETHQQDIRVIVDLVPNHTSDQHPWFRAALAGAPGSPERARYLFRDGRGSGGDEPPNDWVSVFGGSAWTRIREPDGSPGQWFLHLFAPEQPDLDWMDPRVRTEFESILRFWLERGVDGFRIDVAHGLAKDPAMPDLAGRHATAGPAREGHPHWDQDEVHEIYRAWRRVTNACSGERMFVAEAWVHTPERLARYLRADELHTAFNFNLLLAAWDAVALRTAIDQSLGALQKVGAPATWVLSNHDVTRHVTRYGGGELGTRRARAAALLMLALPGNAYIYQGEELGLPEVTDLPDEVLQDPTFFRTAGKERGRDGCRVPLPWSGEAPPFGFGPPGTKSWLPQPAEWAALTAERQVADASSTLTLYRTALGLRRVHPGFADESLRWLPAAPGVLCFDRGPNLRCVVNLSSVPFAVPADAHVLLTSAPLVDHQVPVDTAVWLSLR